MSQTVILTSHRFSTIRSADRICLMRGGRIVELGSHAELMKLDGSYAELFRQQAERYQTA